MPLITGFGLAALSELSFNPYGFAAAVCSVTSLVFVNVASKGMMTSSATQKPHWAQAQLWSCFFAACFLAPSWLFHGGVGRMASALQDPKTGQEFQMLILGNGLMYYLEQVLQFVAIAHYQPLTMSVIDTIRRLSIVIVSGWIWQGAAVKNTRTQFHVMCSYEVADWLCWWGC